MDCKRALQETGGDVEAGTAAAPRKGTGRSREASGRRRPRVSSCDSPNRRGRWSPWAVTEPVSKYRRVPGLRAARARRRDRRGSGGCHQSRGRADRARCEDRGERRGPRGDQNDSRDGEVLAAYVHPPANKIGVLVRARAAPELARLVAMHISFARPDYLTRDDVSSRRSPPSGLCTRGSRRPVETGGDPCEDRRRHAHQAFLRGIGAVRPGVDPRRLAHCRPGARRARGGGRGVRPVHSRGVSPT